jgi:hypothetical protein
MATKMRAGEPEALDKDRIKGRLESQRANRDYFVSNYQDLLSKYRNHWVVISGGELIMSESNPDRFLEKLSKIKREDIFTYFLADPEEVMLLWCAYDTRRPAFCA